MLISKFKIAAFALMAIVLLTFGTFVLDAGSAQEKQGKGKDAMNPKIVEIDLSKLPPDLAKRLGEFARTKDNEDKPDEPKKSSGFQGEPQGQHEVGAEGKKKAKKEEAAQSKNKGKEDRDEDKQDRKRRRKSKRDEDERTSFQQNQKDDGNKNQEGETKVPLDKLPKAVLDSVKVKFPAAKLIGASTEKDGDKTVYEVTLTYKGHHHDVTVEPGGKILDIEKQIARKDLPAAIDAAVERKYPKATWKRVEELSKGDGKLTGYEVLLISATKETWEVLLDPMGKITKEEKKTTKKDAK